MQFVPNGPDIPDGLLQAHEEGRVVFFCGAGVSYPAGLPSFKGLVDEIYRRTGTPRSDIEEDAYQRYQFDATLDLLERRIQGQRVAVRKALAASLRPKLRAIGATDTHAALLQLARNKEGRVRLVTTNFDRVFEHVAKKNKLAVHSYAAPMLPIPKVSRWDGVVYLHGLIPAKPDESALNRLVVTSGDFGLAYLTERWAARFVSELFRNYVVCFVGYSINDPVLRYMMDALAADRMLGEVTPLAYALGDCQPGQERAKTIEWEAKGVTPILYEVVTGIGGHSVLHKTLKAWAETYRDGVLGKERIVVDCAIARPSASTRQDDFVGRLLWALSHESGLPAKRFADFNPVPTLEWLEAFSDDRYRHQDLIRFGVAPHTVVDDGLKFSFLRRPSPYGLAPWMSLAGGGVSGARWDDVMLHLGRWLVRHLNDPALIIWLSQRGGTLHDRLQWQIEDRLDEFARLEREGKAAELNAISVNSPNAIPEPMMRTLWRLLLTGRVKSPWKELDLFRWRDRVKRDGLTATLRFELRELLAPKVTLRKPFRWGEEDKTSVQPKNLKKLVEWELVLSVDHVHSALRDFADKPWQAELLNDFQQLLCDALDLLRELGEAGDRNDRSFWDLPSISDHGQNRGFRDWVALIELLRDSWLAVWAADRERATRKAEAWYELPYPAFKRLAFFAARHDSCIATEQWVDWLLADEAWWLWSLESQREVLRLLVLQGRQLAPTDAKRLEEAILIGPPRAMYKAHLDADEWLRIVERGVWLRLAKLETSGLRLGGVAADRLTLLSAKNPKWSLASNERDEFSHWLSGTGDPDFEESREIEIAPRHRGELVRWLRQPLVKRSPFYEDTWRETCRTRFFTCLLALCDLAQEDIWPVDRWREALQVWSEDALVARSWRYAAPLVRTMSDELLLDLEHGVTWWLDVVSKNIERHDGVLLELCQRVLDLVAAPGSPWAADSDLDGSATTQAINHPVGHVTQALLNLWLTGEPNDNDQLPPEFESVFTRICMSQEHRFQHGRVMLASNSITLFRVDRSWTERNLLPLFQWAVDPVEAKAAWEGFLWSSRIYWPLLVALKSPFLETANRYGELGEMSRQYAALLTYVALEPYEGYAAQDFQAAIGNLPQEGLQEVAQALSQALEAAGERREEYWRNRVQPFWQKIWPKSRAIGSQSISESLARMCIAAGAEFPSALGAVYDWLQPVEHPYYVVHSLFEEGQCSRFPKEALKLLDAVVKEQPWLGDELGKCLDLIVAAALEVAQDPIYQRLREHARRFGR